jgi:hypothetical protein
MTEKQAESEEHGTRNPFQIMTRDSLGLYLMKDKNMIPPDQQGYRVRLKDPEDTGEFEEGINILPLSSRGKYNRRISLE